MAEHARFTSLSSPLQNWLLSQLKSDKAIVFPGDVSADALNTLVRFTADAGIQPYLWYRLNEAGVLDAYPPTLMAAWRGRYLMERINARLRQEELKRVLGEFERRKVSVLVLKGVALAQFLYPEPGLRTACDIDLFVQASSLAEAEASLGILGYKQETHYYFEASFGRYEGELRHQIDLHWKLSDSPYLSSLFAFDELYERGVRLEGASKSARALCVTDALLHACIHLASHAEWDHLIWLLDIDLLARQLTDTQFDSLIDVALEKRCAALCYRALQRTQEVFATPFSAIALSRLDQAGEPTAYLLEPERDVYRNFVQLLRANSWAGRVKLLWQAVFPPLDVVHADYKAGNENSAALIHARRLLHLLFKVVTHYQRGRRG